MKRVAGLVAAFAVVAIVACSRKDQPAGQARLSSARVESDDQIATRIEERLGEKPHFSMAARDVSVTVEHGIATLRGQVTAHEEQEAIHAIAEGTLGVTAVSDEIVVTPEEPSEADSDRVVTQAAMRALGSDDALRGLAEDLHLRCRGGVVTIRSDAVTDAQRRAIVQRVEKMPGVIVVTEEAP